MMVDRFRRRLAWAIVVVVAIVVQAAPAQAKSPSHVDVAGGGCPVNGSVFVTGPGLANQRLTADDRGNFTGRIELPLRVNVPSITATCGTQSFTMQVPLIEAQPDRSYLAIAGLLGGAVAIIGVLITVLRRRASIDLREPQVTAERRDPELTTTGRAKVTTR